MKTKIMFTCFISILIAMHTYSQMFSGMSKPIDITLTNNILGNSRNESSSQSNVYGQERELDEWFNEQVREYTDDNEQSEDEESSSLMKPYINDEMITNTLDLAKKLVVKLIGHDKAINNPTGEFVNREYACAFKYVWDSLYNPALCSIVANSDLFPGCFFNSRFIIRCRDNPTNKWIYLEPSATQYDYEIHDYYTNSYKSRNNVDVNSRRLVSKWARKHNLSYE